MTRRLPFICLQFLLLLALFCMPTSFSLLSSAQEEPSHTSSSVTTSLSLTPPLFLARVVVSEPKKEEVVDTRSASQKALENPYDFGNPSLITQAVTLSIMALLPFIVMILTSFLKIVIVLSLLRSALGVQQAPPNQIINGVAFMLSLFVMYPTVMEMYDAAYTKIDAIKTPTSLTDPDATTYVLTVAEATREPLRSFIKKNSSQAHQLLFFKMAYKVLPESHKKTLKVDDFMVLIPSYITSQLKDAFEIGVLIYIPFFVIDLVTSNILLAMGMMMLSPVTISMPLKLFLLVMLDGWTLLIQGLVSTFR